MNSNKKTGLIYFVVALIIFGIAILSFYFKQSESDCSKAETYDKTLKKCKLKTAEEYVNEIIKKDEEKSRAETEKNRRNGKTCIPASEVYEYIGVTGCVRLGVYASNHMNYGYGWLNSESKPSSTDFAVFARNNILSVEDVNYYFGRIIEVNGTIELYEGRAQIEITNKSAIKDIESIAEHQANINDSQASRAHEVTCEYYLNIKEKCEKGLNMFCQTAKIYESGCKGYVSTKNDSLDTVRENCYKEKIKSAKTRKEKDSVYELCEKP